MLHTIGCWLFGCAVTTVSVTPLTWGLMKNCCHAGNVTFYECHHGVKLTCSNGHRIYETDAGYICPGTETCACPGPDARKETFETCEEFNW